MINPLQQMHRNWEQYQRMHDPEVRAAFEAFWTEPIVAQETSAMQERRVWIGELDSQIPVEESQEVLVP